MPLITMRVISLLVCYVMMACLLAGHGLPEPQSKYQKFIENIHHQGYFNGNVLVSENGKIVYQGAHGISKIDPIDSLRLGSVFRLASVSKQFTAMGIMKLKEMGLLDYDQEIDEIIVELPYHQITIRHLLNHTSGLPDYNQLMDSFWKPDLKPEDPRRMIAGNQDVIDLLVDKKPPVLFRPGEKWEYSNTGYLLLATIVERVSGQRFAQFMQENIFEPAGMLSTSVYPYRPGDDPDNPLRVFGFRQDHSNGQLSHDVHYLNKVQGDGGIYSTLEDLHRWDRALYSDKIVSQATLKEAFTPGKLNDGSTTKYGFGWHLRENPAGELTVSHGGSWLGFQTHIFRNLDKQDCIIVLTNNTSPYVGRVVYALKKLLRGRS